MIIRLEANKARNTPNPFQSHPALGSKLQTPYSVPDQDSSLKAPCISDGLKIFLNISRSADEDELPLFEDELLEEDDLDEDPVEELELDAPSKFSNANTISRKWPANSGSFMNASLHMVAISSGGFRNPGPRPKFPMQRFAYP
jgi:hypothetical protein